MHAANEGSQLGDPDDETRSVGIRVALPFEQGANPFVERVYTHQTFFTRLHHFVRVSNAYVVMPGGLGTTLELMMVWQLLQVRHLGQVPLILVGEMWRELVDWAARWMVAGPTAFASADDVGIPCCVGTVDEAAAVIEEHMARDRAGDPTADP
jgi:predicted Rossmann-fold nucleotide-binding protein